MLGGECFFNVHNVLMTLITIVSSDGLLINIMCAPFGAIMQQAS